jgi:hypothetical protein
MMNMDTTLLWLMRYGHVVGGAIWVGGYFLMALVIIPVLRKSYTISPNPTSFTLAGDIVRVMTYTGMATIFFGIMLITRTRGFGNLLTGQWGLLILSSAGIAIALLGIGDGALRPALRGMAQSTMSGRNHGAIAQRFAYIGLALTILAVGLMTRALYAPS